MKISAALLFLLLAGSAYAQPVARPGVDSVLHALTMYQSQSKDPLIAFTYSLFVPGGGFAYLGDAGQAMACLGIESVSVLWAADMAKLHPHNVSPYVLLALERVAELILAITETNRRNALLRESLGLMAGFDGRRGATLTLSYGF